MNGAIAVPPPRTIKIPNKNKMEIAGASQYFFRCLIKPKISFNKSICSPCIISRASQDHFLKIRDSVLSK